MVRKWDSVWYKGFKYQLFDCEKGKNILSSVDSDLRLDCLEIDGDKQRRYLVSYYIEHNKLSGKIIAEILDTNDISRCQYKYVSEHKVKVNYTGSMLITDARHRNRYSRLSLLDYEEIHELYFQNGTLIEERDITKAHYERIHDPDMKEVSKRVATKEKILAKYLKYSYEEERYKWRVNFEITNEWFPASRLRKSDFSIMEGRYSEDYAELHGYGYIRCFGDRKGAFVLDYIDLKIENDTVWCTPLERSYGQWYDEKHTLESSIGTFRNEYYGGEWLGFIKTPTGRIDSGHFKTMFECDGWVYAISSTNFMAWHTMIIGYNEPSSRQIVYINKYNDMKYGKEHMTYLAYCINDKEVYVLIAGDVRNPETEILEDKTYIVKIVQGKSKVILEKDMLFSYVSKMIYHKGLFYIAMDKVVAVIDSETGDMSMYTHISEEAENDIRSLQSGK